MPKSTRIYTRTGDDGTTGLVGGARVKKSSLRIECYGTVDELSSAIGLARAALHDRAEQSTRAQHLDRWLAWTQDLLFNLGADLATTRERRWDGMPLISRMDVAALERAIDEAQTELQPLNHFIHPGGSLAGGFLHLARTICRRAERMVVALRDREQDVAAENVQYLNRLSDALFVWARWINAGDDREEHRWNKETAPPG